MLPILATEDRLFKISVCLRPFRAAGPRIEAERVGEQLVVHNYGHGGSGWSLSWGSASLALELALAGRDPSTTDLAVLGCGALGLTAAVQAQREGVRSVTIYAKDLPGDTRSFQATGSWTPFSRVALRNSITPDFAARWERMARTSWPIYQRLLNLPNTPVEFTDRYYLSDGPPDLAEQQKIDADPIGFVNYAQSLNDLYAPPEDLAPGEHPFPTQWARRRSDLMFNITQYTRHLTDEFQRHGGRIVPAEFHTPADLARLPQRVVLNCTGYGARALFSDASIIPVRGQIGWLIPQPELHYGLYLDDLGVLCRRDGIVVQLNQQGEASGFNSTDEQPDRAEAELGVRLLRTLQQGMRGQVRGLTPPRTGSM